MNQRKENNIVLNSLSFIYCFSLFIMSGAKTENAESDLELALPPLFCNHLYFAITLKKKPIINNAPLKYVFPNTNKTYLTPNHLLFGRQLLCYSNTASTVVRNLTVLSSTTPKINHISNNFGQRWRHEYVVNLCETQRASKLNINSQKIMLW